MLELTTQCHTARNIQAVLLNTSTKYEVAPPQILGIVTDSPSTMIRLREDFVKLPDFSHIVPLACGMHAFNLIAKDLINYKPSDKTVKTNKRLVNYFNRAIYWKEVLHKWAKDNNIPHKLQIFSPTRWYSFLCVLQGVDTYWYGFQHVSLFVKTLPSTHLSYLTASNRRLQHYNLSYGMLITIAATSTCSC